jgi:hypothetical protein
MIRFIHILTVNVTSFEGCVIPVLNNALCNVPVSISDSGAFLFVPLNSLKNKKLYNKTHILFHYDFKHIKFFNLTSKSFHL